MTGSLPLTVTPPLVRILAIGDELVLGRTVDSNSTHLARWCSDRGLRVERTQTVGDDLDGLVTALRAAADGASLVLCTGGLGPTDDDRTRTALAQALGVELVAKPAAWRAVQKWFAEHAPDHTVPEVNRRQALVPVGARLLPNRAGTAPGLLARLGTAWIACLPGVPHEMRAMVEQLSPLLPRLVPGLRRPVIGELFIAGIGESRAQELCGERLTASHPTIGITVSEAGHIVIRAVGTAAEVRPRMTQLRELLADYALPEAGLAASLVAHLGAAGKTVTAAESCTAGQVVAALASAPGASAILLEAFITYHAAAKTARLGVPAALIRRHGVVSAEVACALAAGARRAAGADFALATTGIAGPGGGTVTTPVGTVWLACADAHGTVARRVLLNGERTRVQQRAAAHALLLLWQVVCGQQKTCL